MAYDAKEIANYFLDLGRVDGKPISPMKLQKLIFFAHGWHLALIGEPLIQDPIEAWEHGPVVASIYHQFKTFGNEPITSRAQSFSWEDEGFSMRTPELPDGDAYQHVREILKRIWGVYKEYSAVQLSSMTHVPGSPWAEIVKPYGGKPPPNLPIPNTLIKDYFAKPAEAKTPA